jgi:hypothetical protein
VEVTVIRSLLAVLLTAGLVLLGPGAGLAQEAVAPPAALAPGDVPPPENAFQLGLANLSGPWPDRFLLFNDFWVADAAVALCGAPTSWGGAQGIAPHQLVGLRALGLGVRFDEAVGADGTRHLVLAPLYRDWDDLDGWEKFGLVLQYAGAAAAIGHFVGKAVH